jgi:hypothetical protein
MFSMLGGLFGGGLANFFSGGLGAGLGNLSTGGSKFDGVGGMMGQGLAETGTWNKLQKQYQDKMEVLQMEQAVQQATHSFAKTTSQNISQT